MGAEAWTLDVAPLGEQASGARPGRVQSNNDPMKGTKKKRARCQEKGSWDLPLWTKPVAGVCWPSLEMATWSFENSPATGTQMHQTVAEDFNVFDMEHSLTGGEGPWASAEDRKVLVWYNRP